MPTRRRAPRSPPESARPKGADSNTRPESTRPKGADSNTRPESARPKGADSNARPSAPALATEAGARVYLHPHGLDLGDGEVLPLWAGAMHYWRHPRAEWRAGLEAMRAMGLRLVDTYVPWGVHERAPGEYDFGENDSRL